MRERTRKRAWVWQIVCLCCLASVLAGCGQLVKGGAASIVASGPMQLATVGMPTTQTACPADGAARAAVMQSLRLGSTPTVVYVFNDVPLRTSTADGRLMRVSIGSADSTEIVHSGINIQWAQVSADGEWILFLSTPDPRSDTQHSGMLQLVRLDGQGLTRSVERRIMY